MRRLSVHFLSLFTMWLSFVLALILVACLCKRFLREPTKHKIIPSPPGYPFLGQALSIAYTWPREQLLQWQRELGDIFQVWTPWSNVVCISDIRYAEEVLRSSCTVDRATTYTMFHRDKGFLHSNGEQWRQTRRFTLSALHSLGVGKDIMNNVIHKHLKQLIRDEILPNVGNAVELYSSIKGHIINIVWEFVSGDKLLVDSASINEGMISFYRIHSRLHFAKLLFSIAPRLRPIWMRLPSVRSSEREFDRLLNNLFRDTVNARRKIIQSGGVHAECYIDALLQQQQQRPELFCNNNIHRCLFELFMTGRDTTCAAIMWTLCYMCTFPYTQTRIQEEVDSVLGRNTEVQFHDRHAMPYTQAFITEVLRCGDITPVFLPRVTNRALNIHDYQIKKGTQIVVLARAMHQNATHFPNPDRFLPERHLNVGEKIQRKELIPFSLGKRSCLGETIATAEIFIIIVTLMQQFNFRFPHGFQHDFSVKSSLGSIREVTNFPVVPIPRDT